MNRLPSRRAAGEPSSAGSGSPAPAGIAGRSAGRAARPQPHTPGAVGVAPDATLGTVIRAGPHHTKSAAPSHAEIERRAYEIFEARGGAGNLALDDWLQAEREFRAR